MGFINQLYFPLGLFIQKNLTPSLPSKAITSAFLCNSNVFKDLHNNASSRPTNSNKRIEYQHNSSLSK